MGEMKTETSETRTIGSMTPEQAQLQQQILGQLGGLSSQFGDLSSLASGDLSGLNPEIAALIEQSQAAARQNAELNYQNALRSGQVAASASGIAGSTAEAIQQALAGQTRDQALAGLDSQAAQYKMQLPFQLAATQLQANQLLQGAFGQNSSSLLNALVQQRLGQGTITGTQTQGGGAFETALGFGSALTTGGGIKGLWGGSN